MTQVEADVAEDVLDSLGHRPGFRLILRAGSRYSNRPAGDARVVAHAGVSRLAAGYSGQRHRHRPRRSRADRGSCRGSGRADRRDRSVGRGSVRSADRQSADSVHDVAAGRSAVARAIELGCDALLQIALASGLHRDADLLYADEVRMSPVSREREPFFKPDFSPDLLLSTNYIGRPWFASTALLGRSGVTVRDLLQAGEYDVVLRCTEQAVQRAPCAEPAVPARRAADRRCGAWRRRR